MKICHIIANLYAGGAQTFVVMLAIEQKSANNDVSVILIDEFNHSDFEKSLRNELDKNGVKCISTGRRPGKNFSVFGSLLRLHKIIKAAPPDIINSHLPITHLISAFYLKTVGLAHKLVLTIHSAPELWNKQTLLLNKHTPAIYCSPSSQEKSIKRDCLQTVINNGIVAPKPDSSADEILTEYKIPKHHKLVLMVGNLSAVKNYPLAVEIAARFEHLEVSFLVCGIQMETFERDLASFKKFSNIHYLGIKIPKEIHSLMNRCDCFLNTSLVEGLPITVLEALNIGTPCVLSPILAHHQLSEGMSNCYISEDFTALPFEQHIQKALNITLSKEQIKADRIQVLRKYSIETSEKQYRIFYQEVLQR